jgi:hypothetical protein
MPGGYCKELSDRERKIYYGAAWEIVQAEYQLSIDMSDDAAEKVEATIRRFLDKNGITEEQLKDIIARGDTMPFTADEELLYQDLSISIADDLTPDETMATLHDLANKYGMSLGQASSVFTRGVSREDE